MRVFKLNGQEDRSENPRGLVLRASKQNQSVNFQVEISAKDRKKPISTLTVKRVTPNGSAVIDSIFSIASPQLSTTPSSPIRGEFAPSASDRLLGIDWQ